MVWVNPQCEGDVSSCNIEGFSQPVGPRVTTFFDSARPTAEVNAELNSQDALVSPGTYRFARVDMCKSYDFSLPTAPTMMWRGPGMTDELAITSGECGRTSLAFDPPLVLAAGDSVEVALGYDLAAAVVSGPPAPPGDGCSYSIAGHTDHCFRTCVDVDATTRDCLEFPDFAPTATRVAAP